MEKSFEVVRHKTRGRDEFSKNQALKLQLDNQYAVLENQKSSHTQYINKGPWLYSNTIFFTRIDGGQALTKQVVIC